MFYLYLLLPLPLAAHPIYPSSSMWKTCCPGSSLNIPPLTLNLLYPGKKSASLKILWTSVSSSLSLLCFVENNHSLSSLFIYIQPVSTINIHVNIFCTLFRCKPSFLKYGYQNSTLYSRYSLTNTPLHGTASPALNAPSVESRQVILLLLPLINLCRLSFTV